MYGVVLMMALGGGAGQPAWTDAAAEHVAKYGDHGTKQYRLFGRRGHGCCGGGGCHGGGYGCYGGGYGGCSGGWGGYGCSGGGWGGYGGCSGGYGGYGCSGGGYGYGYGGATYGGGYYGYAPYSGTTYGGYMDYGTPVYSGAMPAGNNAAAPYGYGRPVDQGRYYDENNPGAERLGTPRAGEAPATLVVRLPADATLTIEGAPTSSTQEVRWFVSPPLQTGKDYQYTLKAEVTRDGKKVERTKEVTVRAGQQNEVTIDLPSDSGSSRK